MAKSFTVSNYRPCDHIKRTKPSFDIDKAILKTFANECNVLPLYEKKTYDHVYMKHYSLESNSLLKCRLKHFVDGYGGRQKTPFVFPNVNDFHFFNNQVRYEPSQSIANVKQFRKHFDVGASIDSQSYNPVPNEMHIRKTERLRKKSAKKNMKRKEVRNLQMRK